MFVPNHSKLKIYEFELPLEYAIGRNAPAAKQL
jgi:hypothetical protein